MILTPQISDKIDFVLGDPVSLQSMTKLPSFPPFSSQMLSFLSFFSQKLFEAPKSRNHTDVSALAFWCRKVSLEKMRKEYPDLSDRTGRGTLFHIAPGNVPVNFAYSLAVGLISGNSNIIRLPSKTFEQIQIITDALEQTCSEMPELRPYLSILRYEHDQEINDYLSSICQTRIIWGGDTTIQTIRKSPLPARSTEITFADRFSIAIIDSDFYLNYGDKNSLALKFFNDTLLTDQNACTSPRIIIWLGQQIGDAQNIFWQLFEELATTKYQLQAAQAVGKLSLLYRLLATFPGARSTSGQNNNIMRVQIPVLDETILDYLGHSGFFIEYKASHIDEIKPICTEKCQTVVCLGNLTATVGSYLKHHSLGIDRVVALGHSMDFSLCWDGYDLPYYLTKKVIFSGDLR